MRNPGLFLISLRILYVRENDPWKPFLKIIPAKEEIVLNEKITALYERLSRDDDQEGESNSIVNQKRYLESYAAEHGFTNCRHYTDDGWSGGNFDRPGWKSLIADVEAGKVGVILAKDMSRVGRNYLETGFYTEVFFRKHDVRFIAIANGVDNDQPETGEFVPFLNIMNDWYLKDQSKKLTAAYQVRGKAGQPTNNNCIYGYRKDPEDKHHWLIDEEAAGVVRRIYQMACEGHGPYEIARILTAERVDNPGFYFTKHACGLRRDYTGEAHAHDWNGPTVTRILTHQEYMGHTVNFRSGKRFYRDKRHPNPREKWLIFENTHEPIVTKETWELAQCALKSKKRTDTLGVANPLTGLLYCAECGQRMYNHRHGKMDENGLFTSDSYNCSTYTLSRKRETAECVSHQISTKNLRALILKTIRSVSRYAIANEVEFARRVREASELRQAQEVREAKNRIRRAKKRCAELDVLIKKLYEAFALGKLTEKRFDDLLAAYEKEQAELKALLETDERELQAYEVDSESIASFLAIARRYRDADDLTTPMIYAFIEKIIVHAPEKNDGERHMQIDIYLKFIGNFQVPQQEMTPEEAAEEERRRKQRAQNREKAARHKQKKQKEAELKGGSQDEQQEDHRAV